MIHESYGYVRGIELATENISYLWLYSMIALYFTSPGEHYIGEIINRIKRIGITLVTSTLYNIVIIMSLWFFFIIVDQPFNFEETILRYSHPLIYSFVYLWYVLTRGSRRSSSAKLIFYCCIRHHLA